MKAMCVPHFSKQRNNAAGRSLPNGLRLLVAFGLVACFTSRAGFSPAIAGVEPGQSVLANLPDPLKQQETTYHEWSTENWSGDEKPYNLLARQIDQETAISHDSQEILSKYRQRAQLTKVPGGYAFDPLALYGWAYAAWKTDTPSAAWINVDHNMYGLQRAFDATPSPHTYPYALLRFLTENYLSSQFALLPLGERLLKRDPNNYFVMKDIASAYIYTAQPESIRRGVILTRQLVHSHPERAGSYALLGGAYMYSWHYAGIREDGQKAVEAYQTFLKKAPPSADGYPDIQRFLKHIQDRIAPSK